MSLTNEQIVEAVAAKSLMEVMDLVKAMEEKFGVSAAAPVPWLPPARPLPAAAAEEQTEFDVIAEERRREEGRSDQGRPRHHGPGPEGSQGPGRSRWRP